MPGGSPLFGTSSVGSGAKYMQAGIGVPSGVAGSMRSLAHQSSGYWTLKPISSFVHAWASPTAPSADGTTVPPAPGGRDAAGVLNSARAVGDVCVLHAATAATATRSRATLIRL
jgi:hypothetical protein